MLTPVGLPTVVTPRWRDALVVIAGLELRQRIRATRWRVSLLVVFAVLSLGVLGSLYVTLAASSEAYHDWSRNLYEIVIYLVLFLGIIISPTLSATAINGDRRDATLATVQATPITHWQLATGKLLGSWTASMTLLVVAAPYLIWGAIAAPYGPGRCLLGILLVAVIFACYCGMGLGFSALTARPAGSAIMTQATVLFLLLGLPALFGILLPSTTSHHWVTDTQVTYGNNFEIESCNEVTAQREFFHTERTWWLLAPNPVLIIADATAPGHHSDTASAVLAEGQSRARSGPLIYGRTCAEELLPTNMTPWQYREQRERAHYTASIGHSWYLGIAVNLIIGAAGWVLAARRLQVPAGRLPRGVRVA